MSGVALAIPFPFPCFVSSAVACLRFPLLSLSSVPSKAPSFLCHSAACCQMRPPAILLLSLGATLAVSPLRPPASAPFCEQVMAEVETDGAYASELHFAVKENDVEKVRSLLQEGSSAKVTSRDAVGRTPLHWALVFGNDEAAKVLIINTPRRALDTRDQQGCTPLHYAAARAHATMARVLIERGASVNAVDNKRRTPLHYAAQQASPEMVELLVSRGADKALPNVQGELPLDVAFKWGSLSSIPCLTPDPAKTTTTTTTTASDKQPVEIQQNTTVGCAPVDDKSFSKKGPSLEKLLSVWKAAETETRRKKEAELAAAHKANAALEEALRAWRVVEQSNKSQRLSEELSLDSDEASTSMSGSKPVVFTGLSIEIGDDPSSCDEDDSASSSCTQRRDLSWCTEWEVQESVPKEAGPQSPRDRKLMPSAWKEENNPWVQVWPARKADGASSSSAFYTTATH